MLAKDIPFLRSVMPQEFSAVLVKGRSNYISLRRLDVAAARADGDVQQARGVRPAWRDQVWAGQTDDGSRSDLDFKPLPSRLGRGRKRERQLPGPRSARGTRTASTSRPGGGCWSANMLIVNHALFMTDLALGAAGSSLLPEYDVAIFDEAHTLEAVAGEHLGLQVSNSGRSISCWHGSTTTGAGRACSSYHKLQEAMDQVQTCPHPRPTSSSSSVARMAAGQGALQRPAPKPLGLARHLCEELRKLAAAIGDGLGRGREAEEQRIELTAAQDRAVPWPADRLEPGSSQSPRTASTGSSWSERSRPRVTPGLGPARHGAEPAPRPLRPGARPAS